MSIVLHCVWCGVRWVGRDSLQPPCMRLFGKTSSKPGGEKEESSGLVPAKSSPRNNGEGEIIHATSAEYDIGVASDCNHRYRKTMEDAHVVITDYMGIRGCGYFAVFDGHAGSQCSKAVGETLHLILANVINSQPQQKDIALALSDAFQLMDSKLHDMDIRHSGSTAVVAIACYMNRQNEFVSPQSRDAVRKLFVANAGDSRAVLGVPHDTTGTTQAHDSTTITESETAESVAADTASDATVPDTYQQPVLDARRLTYDHRCSDINEQRRVANKGGLMINSRVNGMLAVTRSLGDLFMKEYVVGAPYTTETDVTSTGHEVLVIACDGLWDVCSDEKAVQIAHESLSKGNTPLAASEKLLAHALEEFSVDNLTVMVVAWNPSIAT